MMRSTSSAPNGWRACMRADARPAWCGCCRRRNRISARSASSRSARRGPALSSRAVEPVGRAGEGGAEAAILVLEHVDDAGEAALRPAARHRARSAPERPACMRLTMAPNCAAISPADCVPAMPSACTAWSGGRRSAAAAPAAGGEHADGGAGMPALADMFRPHAHADARADLVAGDAAVRRSRPVMPGRSLGDGEHAPAASRRRHAARRRGARRPARSSAPACR